MPLFYCADMSGKRMWTENDLPGPLGTNDHQTALQSCLPKSLAHSSI